MEAPKLFSCCSIILFVFVTVSVGYTPEEDFAFQTFLMREMKNYSSWLQSQNLDPTILIPDVIDISQDPEGDWWNITGMIRNQRVFNHSDVWNWNVDVDLNTTSIRIQIDMGEFAMIGEYEVFGTYGIGDECTFKGSGNCTITSYWTSDREDGPWIDMRIQNFGTTSDGYVDLSVAAVSNDYLGQHKGTFEGLETDNCDKAVSDHLAYKHFSQTKAGNWLPLPEYLISYLGKVFEDVPLADIIGS